MMKDLIKDLEILKEVKNDDILVEMQKQKEKLAETAVEVFILKMEYDVDFRNKYLATVIDNIRENLQDEMIEELLGGLK